MRIAVIGAGAMGGLFAARLAEGRQDVCLVEISQPLIDAIAQNGLRLTGEFGDATYQISINTADRYQGEFDLLIVFTKGMHTRSALESCAHLIGPQTWALTVQNGIGNVETIAAFVPCERIAMGMTNWPSTLVEPGHIHVPGSGQVRLWSAAGGSSQDVDDLCTLLNEVGLNCQPDPDVEAAIWEKLAFNSALNSLAAVTGMTVGEMAERPEAREIVFALLAEALAVADASGVEVDAEAARAAVEHAFSHHGPHKPSMLQDRLAGRPMEIDTITGAVAREGTKRGAATPVTRAFVSLLSLLDNSSSGTTSQASE